MIKNIALIEFVKIAVGIKAADIMLKAADVELLHAKFICPGKYSVLISGSVSAVESALAAGLESSENKKAVIQKLLISNVEKQVVEIIKDSRNKAKKINSLGILEYNNIASGIKAADNAVKFARVKLVKLRLAMAVGGKSILVFTGDNESCKQALKSVEKNINNKYLISKSLISSPHQKLKKELLK